MTEQDPDRRLFLRGGRPTPIRPPWAIPEQDFLTRCTRCGTCIPLCPQGILQGDLLGYPVVDFTRGGCTFCGVCRDSCLPQALIARLHTPAWAYKAIIDSSCLNNRGIPCRVCGEHCDTDAIVFRPASRCSMLPELIHDRCNGCGACISPCPTQAIRMNS
ncbi:MAG: ferredoxin-type protein NapF [Thermodesulfobacteriota bacterium]